MVILLKLLFAWCLPYAVVGVLWMLTFTVMGIIGWIWPHRIDERNRFPARFREILFVPLSVIRGCGVFILATWFLGSNLYFLCWVFHQ